MRTVLKQVIQQVSYQTIQLPLGAEVLSVADQRGKICVWYLCPQVPEDNPPHNTYGVFITGTGLQFKDDAMERCPNFVGALQSGPYVFHVFTSAPVRR